MLNFSFYCDEEWLLEFLYGGYFIKLVVKGSKYISVFMKEEFGKVLSFLYYV